MLQVAGVVTLSLVINGSIIGVIYNRMNVYPENTHTVRPGRRGAAKRPVGVFCGKPVLCGAFSWARRALNGFLKRAF